MVFTVRCYKCGENSVRLVLGGRAILHARCQACSANLLAEVLALEKEVERHRNDRPDTAEFDEDELPTDDL